MMDIITFVYTYMSKPEIIMAAIGIIGCILMKKTAVETIRSVLKIYVGVSIFEIGLTASGIGMGPMVSGLIYILEKMGTSVAKLPSFTTFDAISATAGPAFIIAFFVNLAVARFTRWKYVYLTFQIPYLYAITMGSVLMNYGGFDMWTSAVISGVLIGFSGALLPALIQPITKQFTGRDDIAYGHWSSGACALGAFVGSKVGNKEKSMEDLKLSGIWEILKEWPITLSISMIVINLIIGFLVGKAYVEATWSAGENWIIYLIRMGVYFVVGMHVVTFGIRTFLGELTSAFAGFAKSFAPGAVPALDSPVFFQYAPVSLMIGFIISQVVSAATMGLILVAGSTIPVSMITFENFYGGGIAAGMGNAVGGRRGAIVAAVLWGFSVTLAKILVLPFCGPAFAFNNFYLESDTIILTAPLVWIIKLIGRATF